MYNYIENRKGELYGKIYLRQELQTTQLEVHKTLKKGFIFSFLILEDGEGVVRFALLITCFHDFMHLEQITSIEELVV